MTYLNKKAQSLTELAAFGSVLLLVLSFFIRYGLQWNYRQEAQMRTFRVALSEAYNNQVLEEGTWIDDPTGEGSIKDPAGGVIGPDASINLQTVDYRHIPNPADMFGVGDAVPIESSASVVWGVNMDDEHVNQSDLPRVQYAIAANAPQDYYDSDSGVLTAHEYMTAGYSTTILGSGNIYVEAADGSRLAIPGDTLRIYRPDEDAQPQAMILLPGNETELVSMYAIAEGAPLKSVIRVEPEDGEHGDSVSRIVTLSSLDGEINLDYSEGNINADLYDDDNYDGQPDVTVDNLQGLVYDNEVEVTRNDRLSLDESSGGSWQSTDAVNTDVTIRRKIILNSGTEDIVDSNLSIEGGATWETPK